MEALRRANAVRSEIARVKREVAALGHEDGARRVASMLRDPDDAVGATPLDALIMSINRMGTTRMGNWCNAADLSMAARHRRVRELTERQQHAVAEAIERIVAPPSPRWPGTRAERRERHERLARMVADNVDFVEIADQLGYAHAESARRVAVRLGCDVRRAAYEMAGSGEEER